MSMMRADTTLLLMEVEVRDPQREWETEQSGPVGG